MTDKTYFFRALIDLNIVSYLRSFAEGDENACWGDESWPVYWTPGPGGSGPPPYTLSIQLRKANKTGRSAQTGLN